MSKGKAVRRWMAAVLPVMLLAGLTGCGGDDDKSTTGAASSKNLSGTITVWDAAYKAYPDYTAAADRIDAAFEKKYPGVKVKHVPQVIAKYDQVLQAAFTGRQGADVLRLHSGNQGVLLWRKGLEKLNDRVTPEMRETMFGWNMATPGFAEEGDIYGIPTGAQGIVFYYNKKVFKQAGLPTDFKPESWDEVIAAGKKLQAAGFDAFTGGNKEGYESRWWFDQGWASTNTHEEVRKLSRGEMSFTDPAVKAALKPTLDMQAAGLFRKDRYTTPVFPDGAQRFGDGKAGMYLGLMSTSGYYRDWIPKLGAENIGVFFAPKSKFIGVSPNNVWSIPSYTDKKEEAWAYIEFVTSKESAATVFEVGGILPNRSDVEIPADAPPPARDIVKAMRENPTFPIPEHMVPGTVMFAFDMEMNEVLQGRKSLDKALQTVQEAAEKAG